MQKRKYTHLQAVEGIILSVRQDGMTFQEIADEPGLEHKQLRNRSYRHNCEGAICSKESQPSRKADHEKMAGRPSKILRRN